MIQKQVELNSKKKKVIRILVYQMLKQDKMKMQRLLKRKQQLDKNFQKTSKTKLKQRRKKKRNQRSQKSKMKKQKTKK